MQVIKRYRNRKLYSVGDRHYVTLARVGELVRQGVDLQVVEHVTGTDITAQTLAQVIYDEERRRFEAGGPPLVATSVLEKCVRDGLSALA